MAKLTLEKSGFPTRVAINGRQDIFGEGRDHAPEGRADHNADCHINHIAAKDELLETAEHGVPPRCGGYCTTGWDQESNGSRSSNPAPRVAEGEEWPGSAEEKGRETDQSADSDPQIRIGITI